ncbi:MAG: hypothetical protein FWC80_01480 [Firmicutes bacterium]|nr:hypothetical protein [Bacillota bacterium]
MIDRIRYIILLIMYPTLLIIVCVFGIIAIKKIYKQDKSKGQAIICVIALISIAVILVSGMIAHI